ncbi:MAG: alkaline phosphatase family protein, partial [Deltaproteobacteria bacterium]|nr:alkaline phosphatase family protein [Deltaproteobacteria bacterium]
MTDEFTANSRDIQPARRVLVIGLDGATWTILKPLVEANELPVLNKLMSAGAYGAMRTVLPPTSAPSWTSAFTGQNPGKHGVYEFFVRRSVENGFTYVDSRSRATKALWEILGERGKSVGVVNILTTHPAEKVKGFMMSGSFAPYPKTDFFYPPSLGERLRQKFGKFKLREPFHPKYWGHRISNYVTLWREILAIRTEINLFLMEEYPWDFLMTVISCTDHIQHAAWKYIDETHPEHIPGHRDAFIAFYRDVDAAVGKLVEKADDGETSIIIMSDHGFGPRYKHFFLSQWLEDMGWLKTKDLSTDFLEATFVLILQRMGISNERAKVLSSYITRAIDVISPLPLARLLDRILRTVGPKVGLQYYPTCDWSQTKVYCSPC